MKRDPRVLWVIQFKNLRSEWRPDPVFAFVTRANARHVIASWKMSLYQKPPKMRVRKYVSK